VRGDGQQTLEFIVSNYVVSMAHSISKIVPDAPPNLAFSFHTSSWKGEGVKAVTSKDGVGEEGAV